MSGIFILFLITCTSLQITDVSSFHSSQLHLKYGGHALIALQRLLNFFETDASNLNLDGLYGLRIAQGQLDALHQIRTSNRNEKHSLTDDHHFIQSLITQIDRIANISLTQIAHEEPTYLHRFNLIAYQPFIIKYQSKAINTQLIETDERNSSFDEEESDKCFAELLGSNDAPNPAKCSISKPCWTMMTASKTEDYRLTHQLLWFLIAKRIDCIREDPANRKLNQLEDYFCANIYQDAQLNLLNNFNQDLFLEQSLLCAMIGYEDFLRFDWLQTILSWQHPDYGCFSDASETIRFHSKTNKRHLSFEQEMNNGCLSHKSGLAAGLLATYSRAFLQSMF